MDKETLFGHAMKIAAPRLDTLWSSSGHTPAVRQEQMAEFVAVCYEVVLAAWKKVEGRGNP